MNTDSWANAGQRAVLVSVFLAGVVVQTTWARLWRVAGCYPDLYIVLSVCAGLTLGARAGSVVGLVLGYLEGISIGQSLGSYLISRTAVALLSGIAATRLNRDNPWVLILCVLGGTLVGEIIFLIMSPNYAFACWTMILLKEAPYNAALAIIVYPLLLHYNRRSTRH